MVVLARGELAGDSPGLGVRMALALPLGGVEVTLVLAGAAAALGLERAPQLEGWASGVERELEALVREEEAPLLVERESLTLLGLAERPLRRGAVSVDRDQLAELVGRAEACLVL